MPVERREWSLWLLYHDHLGRSLVGHLGRSEMITLAALKYDHFGRPHTDPIGRSVTAAICRSVLHTDPFTGTVFVFRNRRRNAMKLLVYDGQGFWLCYKRLSRGKLRFWPTDANEPMTPVQAHQLQVLLRGGNPQAAVGAEQWRPVSPQE
jgi:transposase